MDNQIKGSLSDFFFNLPSSNEKSFYNYVFYGFSITLITQIISVPVLWFVDLNGSWILFLLVPLMIYGPMMRLTNKKLETVTDEIICSHLSKLKLATTAGFFIGLELMGTLALADDHPDLGELGVFIWVSVNVFVAYIAYTGLRALRQGLAFDAAVDSDGI